MKLKTFGELLRENNVKKPLLFKKRFYKKWKQVENIYKRYGKVLNEKEAEWERLRLEFRIIWGEKLPTLDELCPNLSIRFFRGWKDAKKQIRRSKLRLKYLDFDKMIEEAEAEARIRWIEELIAKAPDNTVLIVIKENCSMAENSKKQEIVFNCSVHLGVPISACDGMHNVWWTAISPKNSYSFSDTRWWKMRKNSSTVEYVK